MERENIVFTATDKKILDSYKNLVGGFADYFGNGYEFVLHSLDNLDNSVIAIINGEYTGRKIGSPITDLALYMLTQIEENQCGDYISYFNKNRKGDPLKSTTIAIRGENNRVIGLLCINLYLNISLNSFIENLIAPSSYSSNDMIMENFEENVEDLFDRAISECQLIVENNPSISSVNKNKEIIYLLYQKGIFNLKDSVVYIAKKLNISKNTVYLHLRNINKE